ncbi:hypothetical protein cypCar_00046799, partial [Cyprinus carpio]
LPGYSADPLNASLALSQLRSNDSGTFRCHLALGENYEQDTVNLEVTGEVFPAAVPERLTHVEASAHCTSLGGRLATVGQLYLSWRSGLDHCEPAWLSDGSVRFSVSSLHSDCPAGEPGVRTLSQTELNNGSMRFDAFCYRDAQTAGQSDLPDLRPANWTGQLDLDKEPLLTAEPAELSAEYLTVRLRAGDTSLDWSGQLDSFPDSRQVLPDLSPGGSAREEEDEDEGLSGQSVSPAAPSDAPPGKAKSPLTNIVSSLWKPWSYLTGSEAKATTTSVTDDRTTSGS